MADGAENTAAIDARLTETGRSCGSCTLCCKIFGVPELNKPAGQWCPHCDVTGSSGGGCRIHATRPEMCRAFVCGWLVDTQFGEGWKPERSKIVLMYDPNRPRIVAFVDPARPLAWRAPPFYEKLKELSRKVLPDGQVIVMLNGRTTVVLPNKEVELGVVEDGANIVIARTRLPNGRFDLDAFVNRG